MIPHIGNECPVEPNTYVRVAYRGAPGFLKHNVYLPARLFSWTQNNTSSDIQYYEIKPD